MSELNHNSNRQPAIRFKGFTDPWEQRKLGDFSDIRDGTHASPKYISYGHPMVTSKNLTNSGLDMEDVSFLTDEDFNEINKRSKVHIGDILFGMIGTIGHPVIIDRDDFAIKNVALIKEKTSDPIINRWLLQYFKSPYFNQFVQKENAGGTQKFIALGLIRNMELRVPQLEEQKKIGLFFKQFDNLIALHQRKVEVLQNLKKALLQRMFASKDNPIPDIRFAGFTDPWEQRKLGKEFEKTNERNDGSFGKEHWISVAKMYFQDAEKVQSNNINTRTYVMRAGDIAFEGHPNAEFQFGRFVANDIGSGIVSELFPIYRHKQDYDNNYWKHAIQLERIMAPIFAKSITSSGNSSNKLDPKHFLRQKIYVAPYNEQRKIGKLFGQFDNLIALHQRKVEVLQDLKKALLQKMFI